METARWLVASLRGQVLSCAGDLGTKMSNVNRLLYCTSDSNRYATFLSSSRTLQDRGLQSPALILGYQQTFYRCGRRGFGNFKFCGRFGYSGASKPEVPMTMAYRYLVNLTCLCRRGVCLRSRTGRATRPRRLRRRTR